MMRPRTLSSSFASIAILLFASAAHAQGKKAITVKEQLLMPSWGNYTIAPAGNRMLFTKSTRDPDSFESTSHIFLYDFASGKTTQLTASPKGESNPRWMPDGRIVFSSNRDGKNALWAISPDGGEAVKLVEDEKAPSNGSFSTDFTRIAFTEPTERADKKEWDEKVKKKDDGYHAEKKLTYTQIHVYDIAGGKKKQITSGNFDNSGPTWSPDGRWIVFTSNRTGTQMGDPDRSDNTDIFIVAADSGESRRLTTSSGPDRGPVWSPDGKWIAYSTAMENHGANQNDLAVIAVDGGAPKNLTSDFDFTISGIDWSPDGRTLYFRADQGLTSLLFRIRVAGGTPERVLPDDENVYALESTSKDGSRWIVSSSSLTDPGSVFIADTDGRNMTASRRCPDHQGLPRRGTTSVSPRL